MPKNAKSSHSNRFILSASGLALLALVLAISAEGSYANIAGSTRAQPVPGKCISHTKTHTLFPTGDIDFDYAANMRMHRQIAVEMSEAQIRHGKDKRLRSMAMRSVTQYKNEIAELDRWMTAQTDTKSRALLSSK